ncbi:MAG: arsenosugar biosynthesis radical SAM (seleno)protein ArsS [Candidatus Binatia bacterium]
MPAPANDDASASTTNRRTLIRELWRRRAAHGKLFIRPEMPYSAEASAMESIDPHHASFTVELARHGLPPLRRGALTTLQVNVGKLCNQACHHCHVDAGPKRTEIMTRPTAERVVEVLAASATVETVDITGGAPELNPSFRHLVESARRLGKKVIDRCNLTVLFEPGMDALPAFLAEHRVELTCSLPCYTPGNVDKQRGKGVFDKSIEALRWLNGIGYGRAGSDLVLNLVYNPLGPFLPPAQEKLEVDYKRELGRAFGIEFNRLFTITNMPIKRFAADLERSGKQQEYMGLLVNHFNPSTVEGLMCRSLVSVGWEGTLYDCDFNQMLEIPVPRARRTIFDVDDIGELAGAPIATDSHCFGCTAGAGSSCGGETLKGS